MTLTEEELTLLSDAVGHWSTCGAPTPPPLVPLAIDVPAGGPPVQVTTEMVEAGLRRHQQATADLRRRHGEKCTLLESRFTEERSMVCSNCGGDELVDNGTRMRCVECGTKCVALAPSPEEIADEKLAVRNARTGPFAENRAPVPQRLLELARHKRYVK